MLFNLLRSLTLVLIVTSSADLWAGALSKAEEHNMLNNAWKLPSELSEARIEYLLQTLSDEIFDKGFRYIGVEEDLFHGHLLFERIHNNGESTLYPRAILYHTQEEAHKAHWEKTIDPKYDYLNVANRNWIQWLSDDANEDGRLIENAKKYVDATKKDPAQFETDFAEPQEKLHYTIHASNLDPQKLGFVLAGELQFEFEIFDEKRVEPYPDYMGVKGPIHVDLPGQNTTKLNLSTRTMFLERNQRP